MKRPVVDFGYLDLTLEYFINRTDNIYQKDTSLLIYVADFKEDSRQEVVSHVVTRYRKYIDSGFIQILLIKEEAYPPLANISTGMLSGTSPQHATWRAKQVLDYAFMFEHGKTLNKYYLQIEDDVMCAENYATAIRQYIRNESTPWRTIDFSELGFIGKLFKSSDLDKLSKFLFFFYKEQPVDWLYEIFRQSCCLARKEKYKKTNSLSALWGD